MSDANIHTLLGAGYYPPGSQTRSGVRLNPLSYQHGTDLWSR